VRKRWCCGQRRGPRLKTRGGGVRDRLAHNGGWSIKRDRTPRKKPEKPPPRVNPDKGDQEKERGGGVGWVDRPWRCTHEPETQVITVPTKKGKEKGGLKIKGETGKNAKKLQKEKRKSLQKEKKTPEKPQKEKK